MFRAARIVFLAIVLLLVVADPTPRFLGIAADSESPQKAIPTNGGANDFDPPVASRPPAPQTEECIERAAFATPPVEPLAREPRRLAPAGVGPLRAKGFLAPTRSAPLRC